MNRAGWLLLLCLVAGCSTHPIGDFLDFWKPGRMYADPKVSPYGGVCRNQGPVAGPGAGGPPQINVGPVQPVVPPPVPVTGGIIPEGPTVPPPPPPPNFPR